MTTFWTIASWVLGIAFVCSVIWFIVLIEQERLKEGVK